MGPKSEYVALSPFALAAAVVVGVLIGAAINAATFSGAVVDLAIAALLAFQVRSDARHNFASGTYRRKSIVWQKIESTAAEISPVAVADEPRVTLQ